MRNYAGFQMSILTGVLSIHKLHLLKMGVLASLCHSLQRSIKHIFCNITFDQTGLFSSVFLQFRAVIESKPKQNICVVYVTVAWSLIMTMHTCGSAFGNISVILHDKQQEQTAGCEAIHTQQSCSCLLVLPSKGSQSHLPPCSMSWTGRARMVQAYRLVPGRTETCY